MSIVNLNGLSVSKNSYNRARQIVDNKPQGTRKSASDVLSSLRSMMPDWNISTSSDNWGEGARNIEITERTLELMARDPEAMVRYKALILDLEDAVAPLEDWKQQNEGKFLEFGIVTDTEGNQAMGLVRTLIGGETRTTFDLTPSNKPIWAQLIQQKINALSSGQVEDAEGGRSWIG